MGWLANLDARVAVRPVYVRWPYLVVKWLLVSLGAFGAVGLAYQELTEKRAGLGLGIVTTAILAGIKGVVMGLQGRAPAGDD